MIDSFITILGCRGSVPVCGERFLRYGGATTCFLVSFQDRAVLIDAGTGLMNLPENLPDHLPLLLTHPHADHLLGLPMCSYIMRCDAHLDIYAVRRNSCGAEEQVRRFMSPPLWPVGPEHLPAEIRFLDLPDTLDLNGVQVDVMEGIHPGGVSLLRLAYGGKSVVIFSDCTLSDSLLPRAAAFARNCDLLLCDGQYSETEWAERAGFGHSTWSSAAHFAARCGAKAARVIHHDPLRTDTELDNAAEELRGIHPRCAFAREGEVIAL